MLEDRSGSLILFPLFSHLTKMIHKDCFLIASEDNVTTNSPPLHISARLTHRPSPVSPCRYHMRCNRKGVSVLDNQNRNTLASWPVTEETIISVDFWSPSACAHDSTVWRIGFAGSDARCAPGPVGNMSPPFMVCSGLRRWLVKLTSPPLRYISCWIFPLLLIHCCRLVVTLSSVFPRVSLPLLCIPISLLPPFLIFHMILFCVQWCQCSWALNPPLWFTFLLTNVIRTYRQLSFRVVETP